MKIINLKNVPDQLHQDFKVYCAINKTNITRELIRLMEQALKQEKKGNK